tara:strand:+ start:259 stop:540 length:282 start_codon:yes stop_codon:yes gene_type:complete
MNRYSKINRISIKEENRTGNALITSQLPDVEENNSDLLLIATAGDKCDSLAQQYYGDSSMWWFIASINNLKSNNIEAGTQLRIPISTEQAKLK